MPRSTPTPLPGRSLLIAAAMVAAVGCEGAPEAPDHPTWADVQPILQGECNHCHGASAKRTGSLGPATYRFDFFDMTDAVCGEATAAMDLPALAAASAGLIKTAVTPGRSGRARMPPAPASPLHGWELETLRRWADQPVKGPPPAGNRRPRIRVNRLPASVSTKLSFIATIEDPDADPVIGVIRFGPLGYQMDHDGSYAVEFDMSAIAAGTTQRLTAVLCDGWGNTTVDLGPIDVTR